MHCTPHFPHELGVRYRIRCGRVEDPGNIIVLDRRQKHPVQIGDVNPTSKLLTAADRAAEKESVSFASISSAPPSGPSAKPMRRIDFRIPGIVMA